jgi:hypothetical protein
MSFELDEKVDLTRARTVELGGKVLKVAPLTLQKIIKATEMLPQLNNPTASPHDNIDRLVDFVLLGLSRTYPQLSRDDLLESEITVDELRKAADVVIIQAGGKLPNGADAGGATAAAG